MSQRLARLSLIAMLLAGCTTGRLPGMSFADPAALELAMNRYYEAHATENLGRCSNPYIDGLTQVAVVDKQPERLTVEVGYLYRDWQKDDSGPNSFGDACTGYGTRSFTLGKSPTGGVEVLAMNGPRRS